jgi:hypothetical protein
MLAESFMHGVRKSFSIPLHELRLKVGASNERQMLPPSRLDTLQTPQYSLLFDGLTQVDLML